MLYDVFGNNYEKICISVAAILNLAIQKFLKGDKVASSGF